MENKPELKEMLILSFGIFLALNIIFFIIDYMEYRKYTNTFNSEIGEIIQKVKENYPNVEMTEIMQILNSSTKKNNDVLRAYGIDLGKDTVVIANERSFLKFLVLEAGIIFILFISLLVVFLGYNKKKDKKLKEITRYIEEINRRNYKLDIEDNTEDELSILKNEVYKTTVMLKEVAENSKQDKMKLKDSLSDISHQLKTPLTSITITLDNMLENKDMEENIRTDFIKDIKREIININFLVNTLLKLSKFDANTINFINKEEKIIDILNEAIKNVAGICDLKDIEIRVKGDLEENIYCDFKWQVEAITNILKNCVEHSYEGEKIDINYNKNNIYAKLEIRDYGSGISEEDLPHIFERFYKGKNSSKDSVRNRTSPCKIHHKRKQWIYRCRKCRR